MSKRFNFPVFSIARIYLGVYLIIVFITSFSSSAAIWSNEGFVPKANLNPTFGVFPNVLNYYDSPFQIKIFLILLMIIAAFFTIGLYRQWAAFLLWYGWTCLLNRNNMIINPSIHYIGWLLLATSIIPLGERWSVSKSKESWQIPPELITGAWILFSVGYFLSGFDKILSISWADGSALQKIISGPLGNMWAASFITVLPDWLMKGVTWLVIVLEILCLPLVLFTRTRKWLWIIVTFLQLNMLVFLSIPVITFGVLSFHIFLFNPGWFKTRLAVKKNKLTPLFKHAT